ncbi:MAG: hypothetical protein Fur0018_22740 [Anaerolineales bacterium]
MEQALYRIAQEALENIVRHARARQVTISLRADDGLGLEIVDDGVGFARDAIPAGRFGLAGMRERAAAAGAALDVDSRPGDGTRIRLTWKETSHDH